jgi:hypothetical protein
VTQVVPESQETLAVQKLKQDPSVDDSNVNISKDPTTGQTVISYNKKSI